MDVLEEDSDHFSNNQAIQAIITYSSMTDVPDDDDEENNSKNIAISVQTSKKRQAIQNIMRDTSLTPRQKQKKIQNFMTAGGKVNGSVQAKANNNDDPSSVPPAPPPDDDDDDDDSDGVSATIPPQNPLRDTATLPPADEGPSKQELVREVMENSSLTLQEKQEKVKQIMATGAPFLNSPLIASRKALRQSSRSLLASSPMQSPSAGTKSKSSRKLTSRFMSPRTTRPRLLPALEEDADGGEKPKTQQDLVREVIRDSSLTLQERQQKVRDIMGRGGARPAPLQSDSRRSLQLMAPPSPSSNSTPKSARRSSFQVPSSPRVGASAIAPGSIDPAARKLAREASRNIISASSPKMQSPLSGLRRFAAKVPSSPLVGASAVSGDGGITVDPAIRKMQRESSRSLSSASPLQSPGGVGRNPLRSRMMVSPRQSPSSAGGGRMSPMMESPGGLQRRQLRMPPPAPPIYEEGDDDGEDGEEDTPPELNQQEVIRQIMKDKSLTAQEKQQKVQKIMSQGATRNHNNVSERSQSTPLATATTAATGQPKVNDEDEAEAATSSLRLDFSSAEGSSNYRPGAVSVDARSVGTSSSSYVDPADRKRQRDLVAGYSSGGGSNHPTSNSRAITSGVRNGSGGLAGRGQAQPDAMTQSMIQTVLRDDTFTEKQKEEQIQDIVGGRGHNSINGRSAMNTGGPGRATYQAPMHTMDDNGNGSGRSAMNGAPGRATYQAPMHTMDDDYVTEEQTPQGEVNGGVVSELSTQESDGDKEEVAGDDGGVLSQLEAYVSGLHPNAVAASGVVTEEEIAEEEEIQKARFLWGGICCFCILVIAIVVPLVALLPKEESMGVVGIDSGSPTQFPTQAPSIPPTPGAVLDLLLELEVLYPSFDDYVAAFNSSDTVQYQALSWATGDGNPGGLSGSDPRLIRRFALATFYFATNGDDWVQCTRDGTNCSPGQEWLLAEDECGWLAVTCDDDTSDVTQIFFPPTGQANGNNVAGTLPFELGLLTNLKRITISRNNIGGSIPSSWADLTTLQAIILSENQLTGELPSSLINNNQGLLQIRLSGNKISQLPQDPIRSSGLTILDLQDNALEGPIPEGIQGLSALQTLDLRGNNLNSTVPESLFQIETLRNLYLADNALSGNISASFGALTDIRRAELTGNNFEGIIPDGLCELKSNPGSLQLLTADCDEVVCACCDNDCAT